MPTLSNEELAVRAKAGDQRAMQDLIANNMGLIWSAVRRYCPQPEHHDDLVQASALRFYRTVQTFDPAKARWSTYATRAVAIVVWAEYRRRAKAVATASLDQDRTGRGWSLAMAVVDERAADPGASIEQCADAAKVRAIIGRMDRRAREIIRRRVEGETLAAVGRVVGLSRERVRQIEEQAFNEVRRQCGHGPKPKRSRRP